MSQNTFEESLKINPSQLDLEAIRQAELFYEWCKKSIKAKSEQDRAKLHLEVTEARLQIECRKRPEDFSLVKVTEAVVHAAVQSSDRYIEAYKDYLEARETTALLEKAVGAMEQRKRMIEVLVTLHGQQYFAGPSVPHDLVQTWKDHKEKGAKELHKNQAQKTRKRGEKRHA